MTEQQDGVILEKRPEGVRVVMCPHCQEEMVVHLSLTVTKVEKFLGYGSDAEERWRSDLTKDQTQLLEWAKRSGLLDSFEVAVRASPNVPNNIEKYFLTWLKLSRPAGVPQWALDQFRDLCPGKFIEFYASNTVGCVMAGSEMQLFLPIQLLTGKAVRTGADGKKAMISADAAGIKQWIKTRNGYVPQECHAVLSTMRTRSFGDFARPVL